MSEDAASPFPSRLLAGLLGLALLAFVPGLLTRGDVLRGAVVPFVAALAAALACIAPGSRGPGGLPRLLLAVLPVGVPALGLLALGEGRGSSHVLRASASFVTLAALTVGLARTWRRGDDRFADARLAWEALLLAGGVAGAWTAIDALTRLDAGVGPFGRPGVAGPVLGALLVAATWAPLRFGRRLRAAIGTALALGCLATLSRTGVSAALLGLLATGGLLAPRAARPWVRRGFVALASLTVLVLALAASGRIHVPGRGDTVEVRLGLARATTKLAAERPATGHGLGSFPEEILRVRDLEEARISRGRRPMVAHNDVLQAAAEGGVGAAVLLLAWALGLLGIALATGRREALVVASGGAFLTLGFASLGESVLLDPATALLGGVAAATIIGLGASRAGSARLTGLAAGGLALLALAVAGVKTRDLLADRHLARYRAAIRGGVPPLDAIVLAREHLEEGALTWRPDHPNAWYRLGVHRAEFRSWDEAREAWVRALESDAGMTEARLDEAESFLHEGMAADARRALVEATHHDPTRFDLRMRLGHLALGSEPVPGEAAGDDFQPIEALRHYNEADVRGPDRFEVRVARARLARRQGNLANASLLLREALAMVAPDAARALAAPLSDAARGEEAVLARHLLRRQADALNELAARPETAEILLESFRVAEREKAVPPLQVTSFLKLALLVNPGLRGPIVAEADRFLALGSRRADAAKGAVRAATERPDLAASTRAFDAAAIRYAALLQADLLDPAKELRRAKADAEARRFRTAYVRFRALLSWAVAQPIEPGPDRAEALDRMGDLFVEAAKTAARLDTAKARHLYARGHAAIGAAFLARGAWEDARRTLERAAEDAPEDAEVRIALARALVHLDEWERAEAVILEAIDLAPERVVRVQGERDLLPLMSRRAVREALAGR